MIFCARFRGWERIPLLPFADKMSFGIAPRGNGFAGSAPPRRLSKCCTCDSILPVMETIKTNIALSPVNMDSRKNLDVRTGDTVRVHQRIEEKGKMRTQVYEGLVLAVKHGKEIGGTITVRKVASGVGMEKIFPIYSPMIEKIEVVRRSRVRRSKLYYIREKVAREIRRKMKRMSMMDITTDVPEPEKEESSSEANTEVSSEEPKTEEVSVSEESDATEDEEEKGEEKKKESPAEEEKKTE